MSVKTLWGRPASDGDGGRRSMPLATYRHGDWVTNLPHEAGNTTSTKE